MISVRALQLVLAIVYLVAGAAGLARAPSGPALVGALVGVAVSYLFAPVLPDTEIARSEWPRVVGVGLLVLTVIVAVEAFGGPRELVWVTVASGFCAGNRLKAAGVGVRKGG